MKKRNIGLAVLFSIITFGIYGIYWYVCLTNDSNKINAKERTAGGGLAVLFTVITFGIYGIYWNYKLGKKLTGSGTSYLILYLFGLGIIGFALGQSEINKYIDANPVEIGKKAKTLTIDGKPVPLNSRWTGKRITKEVIYYLCGIVLSLLFLFPIIYMLATSTKSESSYAAGAGSIAMFLPDFAHLGTMFDNYGSVLTNYSIWKYALNSFLYAVIVIVLNVLVNGLAGYVMAKMRFPGKRLFSALIIFLIIVPVETSIIPLYSIVKIMLGLKQTASILGIILPSAVSIFNVFLFMQFFQSIPKEYEEAARMDGASTLGIFFKVILPLSKPIVATVAVFCFIGVWNDYLWPSMILPQAGEGEWPLMPIQAALTTIQSMEGITTGEIMASLVITSIPIFVIYVAAQKYIVQGFGSAGLKM